MRESRNSGGALVALAACLLVTLCCAFTSALAAESSAVEAITQDLTPQERVDLLSALVSDEQVRERLRDAIARSDVEAQAETPAGFSLEQLQQNFAVFHQGFGLDIASIPRILEIPAFAQRVIMPEGYSGFSIVRLMLGCILIFALGFAAEYYYLGKTRALCSRMCEASTPTFIRALWIAIQRLLLKLISVLVFSLVALGMFFLINPSHVPLRLTLLTYMGGIILIRVVANVSTFIFEPYPKTRRLVPLSLADAGRVHRRIVLLAVYTGLILYTRVLLANLGLDPQVAGSFGLVVGAVFIALIVVFAWQLRRPFARLIMPGDAADAGEGFLRPFLARNWHIAFTVAFIVIFWVALYFAIVHGQAVTNPALYSMIVVALLPFVGAAIQQIVLDFCTNRQQDEAGDDERKSSTELAARIGHIVYFVLLVTAPVLIARIWGVDLVGMLSAGPLGKVLSTTIEILVIGGLAYAAWAIVAHVMSPYMPQQDGPSLPGDEGGGTGASRIKTLMPLFKKAFLVVLVSVTVMIVLSNLGVEIGPLIAGAGIAGIAIGFGAQTLVKDVISGVFFLTDDAFRKGEYIEVGDVRGTVERISIRSFQLRHHNGPVHTVPYGEINSLTNYSRDWAVMKFELRIPFETDVEKVRKIIKKTGQAMMEDEEIGSLLLEPLKSQGVNRMDDSALIVRCKFTARPGHQFYVRRVAYARIQKAFEENGLQFAPKRVLVETMTPELAAAGAAAAVAAEEPQAGRGG